MRARILLVATAVIVAGLDLGAKTWAGRALTDGSSMDLGLLHLRLAFNPGVHSVSATPCPQRSCSGPRA